MIRLFNLTIKGYGCKHQDIRQCRDFGNWLIDFLDVHEIGHTGFNITGRISGAKPGVTLTITFLESHLALHTWPGENGFAYLEITSCKSFDDYAVGEQFKIFFEPLRIEAKYREV